MSLGIDRKTAAEFSFFLAMPTLTGATILQLFKHRDQVSMDDMGLIGIGFFVSFVVAWIVIKAFLAVVTRYGFGPFAWYRIIAGSAALGLACTKIGPNRNYFIVIIITRRETSEKKCLFKSTKLSYIAAFGVTAGL